MALLPILKYPDPRLATKAATVTEFDDKLKQLAADMAETMYKAPGVGLAATRPPPSITPFFPPISIKNGKCPIISSLPAKSRLMYPLPAGCPYS